MKISTEWILKLELEHIEQFFTDLALISQMKVDRLKLIYELDYSVIYNIDSDTINFVHNRTGYQSDSLEVKGLSYYINGIWNASKFDSANYIYIRECMNKDVFTDEYHEQLVLSTLKSCNNCDKSAVKNGLGEMNVYTFSKQDIPIFSTYIKNPFNRILLQYL